MDKLISESDLRAEAQRLIDAGEMPTLDELLAALAEAREKYVPALEALRATASQKPKAGAKGST